MEALIWDNTSSNGADHGPSCAAFASLTLELAAQAVGQQSWVSGGSTYPWPMPEWADVRVDTNPASPDSRPWWRTPRRTAAGTRSATATSPSRATGSCSTATSRS